MQVSNLVRDVVCLCRLVRDVMYVSLKGSIVYVTEVEPCRRGED